MKVVDFITIKDGYITGFLSGDINVDLSKTSYAGHEKVEVPHGNKIRVGDSVAFYDTEWKRYDDLYLYKHGLLPVPEGFIFEDNNIREMTPAELVKAGIRELEDGFKIDSGEIVEMTIEEKVEAGILTLNPTEKIEDGKIIEKSKKELYDENVINADEYNAYIDKLRKKAYRAEADDLFPQVYAGEVSMAEWQAKRTEIKQRFPKV